MSVKSFAEAVKEGKTIYNRLFGIEQAEAEEAEFAPLASPTLTGKPLAPTATALTDNTQVATTAYADSAVGVEKSRAEIKEALLAPLASPALTGTPTVPEAAEGTETTQAASTSFVARAVSKASGAVSSVFGRTGAVVAKSGDYTVAEVTGAAPLASPALTGTPTIEGKDIPTTVEPLAISGIPSAGEVLTATSGTAADWAAPAEGLIGTTDSLLTAIGDDALLNFKTLSSIEQSVHAGNTAIGYLAMIAFEPTIGTYALTEATAIGSSVINLTGIEGKAGRYWSGGTSNTPLIVFRKLTPGVTGLSTSVPYFVVGGTANSFECATSEGGVPIKVVGHKLEAASTEIALLASGEDNIAIGQWALGSLTLGGGNICIGTNAGSALTTGEENVIVGCEAGDRQESTVGNVLIGFRAGQSTTNGEGLVALGYSALGANTTGEKNTAIGYVALRDNTKGAVNVAVGYAALANNLEGNDNTAVGWTALVANTTGSQNVAMGAAALGGNGTTSGNAAVGFEALAVAEASYNTSIGAFSGKSIITAKENTMIGAGAMETLTTGEGNVAVGLTAGAKVTGGAKNVFIGYEAGPVAGGELSNKLYINNSASATPLVLGDFSAKELQLNAAKLGFNKKAPVSLIAESLSTGSLGTPTLTSPYGFATKAEAEAAFKFIEKWSLFMHEAGLTA